jgi:hypothetical protein
MHRAAKEVCLIIPANQISPISQELLKYYDAAQLPGYVNNYVQNNQSPFNRSGFVIRMDFIESDKSQWSGRYSWGNEVQKSGGLSIAGTKVTTGYEQYLGSNTRTLSPNVVNEARFGYTSTVRSARYWKESRAPFGRKTGRASRTTFKWPTPIWSTQYSTLTITSQLPLGGRSLKSLPSSSNWHLGSLRRSRQPLSLGRHWYGSDSGDSLDLADL